MNKKAQIGPIAAVFLFIIFLINWFIWLGGWLANVGELAITSNGLTGIEAFFLSNLNFIVLICMFLGMLGWMYLSSG